MLYQQKQTTHRDTMFAQRILYWPIDYLSSAARNQIKWSKIIYLTKQEVEEHLSADSSHLFWKERSYPIKWLWNIEPTLEEWNRCPADRILTIELRRSRILEEGRVALLSFKTQ